MCGLLWAHTLFLLRLLRASVGMKDDKTDKTNGTNKADTTDGADRANGTDKTNGVDKAD